MQLSLCMAVVLIGLFCSDLAYPASDLTADFAGMDLSGADLQGVVLSGADLTGANLDEATGLAGADLSGAVLSRASLRHVDLSYALLSGTQLNGANLEGANLSGATLTSDPDNGIDQAADLAGAYLKNANLSGADLSGANLTNASFYGSIPAGGGTCDTSQGFTQGCASAAGAILDNTHFHGAFLFGVDFTGASIEGAQFVNAALIGANFDGATLLVSSGNGSSPGFLGALLQGAQLGSATLAGISLQHAFLDFRRSGNRMLLRLPGTHTLFPGWKTPGQAVCVLVSYDDPTTVPEDNPTLVCPDGSLADGNSPTGCGPAGPGAGLSARNSHWKSPVLVDHTTPPGSYFKRATFTGRARTPICGPADPDW
jgi:uncharacterized protein YjbI with pentapeptide repeats